MNIYEMTIHDAMDVDELLSHALNASETLDATFDEGLDIHLEKSAYSKFDYDLAMDRIDVRRRGSLQCLHAISNMLMEVHAFNLPETMTQQFICMDTTSEWYGKCECCGAEIIDGLHPLGHEPYHHM